jgi:ureidoacrylate peracid hydrolase
MEVSMTTDLREILGAERSALLIIDVQNDYIHQDGALSRMGKDTAPIRAIVPNVHSLIELARGADVVRIFVRQTHSHWFNTPGWLTRGRGAGVIAPDRIPLVEEGTWGAEFYEIAPRPDELVITKHRYSAFAYTPLELALHAKGKDTVVLCGATSDVCVEATALDAVMRGFRPVLVADGATAADPAVHASAVHDFADHIGTVVKLADVATVWAPATRVGAGAVSPASASDRPGRTTAAARPA